MKSGFAQWLQVCLIVLSFPLFATATNCPPTSGGSTAPVIFRNSDLVDYGQVVQFFGASMVTGNGNCDLTATGWSFPDTSVNAPGTAPATPTGNASSLTVEFASATTAKVDLPPVPSNTAASVGSIPYPPTIHLYAIQLNNSKGASAIQYFNRAEPWWVIGSMTNQTNSSTGAVTQGGTADQLIPGQPFRVFGRNLFSPNMKGWLTSANATCALTYPSGQSNAWSATFVLPTSCNLSAGSYTLVVHNGLGGAFGFGKTLSVMVGAVPASWPTATHSVAEYVQPGDADSTQAFQRALSAANTNGGGIVTVPPGQYAISSKLTIPSNTQLIGTSTDNSQAVLVDGTQPDSTLALSFIDGDGKFNVQNLTITTATAHRVITCPTNGDMYGDYGIGADNLPTTPCSNVLINNVVINQNTPLSAFLSGAHDGIGGIHTYGKDITVQNSTITAQASSTVSLWNAHHVLLTGNHFKNGEVTFDGFQGAEQSIYESNHHLGLPLTNPSYPGNGGGGVYVLHQSHYLYFGDNEVCNSYGTDGEGIVGGDTPYVYTWMGATQTYQNGSAPAITVPIASIPKEGWTMNAHIGKVVYVLGGTGALQRNYVTGNTANTLYLSSPWTVPIDFSSVLDVVSDHSENIFFRNTFSNVTVAPDLYAQSYGFIIDNNTNTNSSGEYCVAWNYLTSDGMVAPAPPAADSTPVFNTCYFNQWTNNVLTGSLTTQAPNQMNTDLYAGESVMGLSLGIDTLGNTSRTFLGVTPVMVGNEIRSNKLTAVPSAQLGGGDAVIGGVYAGESLDTSCAATSMPVGAATDTLIDSNTSTGNTNNNQPIYFGKYFGNTYLNANSPGTTSQDFSFTKCSPSVAVSYPANGTVISPPPNAAPLSVQVQVAQGNGGAISGVTVQLDGSTTGVTATAAPNTLPNGATLYSAPVNPALGLHYATATVTYSSGTLNSMPVVFNVVNVNVAVTAPSNGATVQGTSVSVSASATAGSGLTIASVQFQIDGHNVTSLITTAPYTATFDSTQLANGTHTLTATAVDSQGDTVLSPSVAISVNNMGGGGCTGTCNSGSTPLLSGFTTGGIIRNNFTGFVGMEFTVGGSPLVVTSLGRIYLGGANAGSAHTVKLVNANFVDVPGGAVTISPSGTIGQFTYGALSSAVVLAANTSYYLVSQEAANGETWYDYTPVTVGGGSGVASVLGPVYTYSNNQYYLVTGQGGTSYVPVNLLYNLPGAPTVSITAPAAGTTVSGAMVQLAASAAASNGLSLTSVQFQVDGVNVGSPVTTSPYATTLDTTALSNGAHNLTAVATDSQNASTTSATVTVTVGNTSASAGTVPLVTAFNPGPGRYNYTGSVGMEFTVGSSPITVTQLGRIYYTGNSSMHTVSLVNSSTGAVVSGGSVSFTPSGTAGQFSYAALAAPVTLAANTSYYLLSTETAGGDGWYDIGGVTTTSAVSVLGPVYTYAGGSSYYLVSGSTGYSYVPVNLLYHLASAVGPTVTITSPTGGTTSGSINVMNTITLAANASASAGASMANVQFFIDNTAYGHPITTSSNAIYSTSLDTSTLTNSTHSLVAVATDSNGNSTTTQAVMFTVNNNTNSGTPLISSFTGSQLRSNFNGFVGVEFTVGASPLTVYSVGRVMVSGNTQTHQVKLVNAQTGADVTGGSAQVSLPSTATPGTFVYANLNSAVTLSANTSYYLVSQETTGQDQWWDISQIVPNTGNNLLSILGPVYGATSGYTLVGNLPNQVSSYVPVSMTYSTNQ